MGHKANLNIFDLDLSQIGDLKQMLSFTHH